MTESSPNKDNAITKKSQKKRWPKWLRITLKSILWTFVSLVSLIVIVLALVVWYLTPEKLTPIVESFANEYVNADVKIGKVELTVWKTFPNASIEVSDVRIDSEICDSVKTENPLLEIGRLRAEVNLSTLPLMRVDINEVALDSPFVNLVALNDSVNNFDILPPSAPDTVKKEKPLVMPDIIMHHFSITNNRGISYQDLSKNAKVIFRTDTVDLQYNKDDAFYLMTFLGGISLDAPDKKVDQTIPFSFKGDVNWSTANPFHCIMRDFYAEVAEMPVKVNTDVSFADTLAVKSLNVEFGPCRYADLVRQIPEAYRNGLDRIHTDFALSVNMTLDKPFRLGYDRRPSFHAELLIPDCYVQPGQNRDYRIDQMKLNANVCYNGDRPSRSVVKLNSLLLKGFGIDLAMDGSAADIFNNPNIQGRVDGSLNLAKALKLLPKQFPFALQGIVSLDTDFKFALSDLSVTTFHKATVEGKVCLENVSFKVPKDSMDVFLHQAQLEFGTNGKLTAGSKELNNVLRACVSLDSIRARIPGVDLMAKDMMAGVGSLGTAADLMDSTKITPIGAKFTIGKLDLINNIDSSKIRLKGINTQATLKRYKDGKLPLVNFDIDANRIRLASRTSSVSLKEGEIKLAVYQRSKDGTAKSRAYLDSLRRVYPDLPEDSIRMLFRRNMIAYTAGNLKQSEVLDLKVNNTIQKVLLNWDGNGSLKAKSGMLFTPYFPLRNVMSNVDMDFTFDNFNVHNITFQSGRSDMSVAGAVSNIRTTLMGMNRYPLTLKMGVNSDSLDVNQIMNATYRGSSFANDTLASAVFNMSDVEDDSKLQNMVQNSSAESDTMKRAILLPKNVYVDFNVHNKHAKYADLNLEDLNAGLLVKDGVLRIRDLSGKAEGGHLRLDMVYTSADKKDLGVGLYLGLDNIQVGKFLHMMPGVDSIMPMLKGVDGLINAKLAMTTHVDSLMNLLVPTTNAALHIDGKDLVLLDSETFRKISKMLLFKDKKHNQIDSISVEVVAYDSKIDIYPFKINMDRYRMGVMGTNDFNMNYNFHVSVWKSPIPFKFGINIMGNPDKMKFRLGGAKLKEKNVARTTLMNDSTKVNLIDRMNAMFMQGASAALKSSENTVFDNSEKEKVMMEEAMEESEFSHADSLVLMQEGLIERKEIPTVPEKTEIKQNNKKSNRAKARKTEAIKPENE